MTPGIYLDVEQGSAEWKQARCGIVTASRVGDAAAMRQDGNERAERRDYRAEIICEILTGQPYPQSAERARQVLWGKEHEADARSSYELQRGVLVDTCGFVLHPEVDRFGASPDGLVGPNDETGGCLQIKCPTTATHIEYWRAGKVPVEHCFQMAAEMACTGREWCDFVSYDPRLPEHLQLFVIRYHRDNKFIALLEREVAHFNAQVDQALAALPGKPQSIAEVLEWPTSDEMKF
jgi:hypothetical protein